MFTFKPKYGLLAIAFFIIEVIIAMFVNDSFIRPFFGDYLVMFLMYCFAFAFWNTHFLKVAFSILLFSYLIETLQYFHFVQYMGWQKYKIVAIVLGTSFSWYDIVAYTLGFLTILLVEYRRFVSAKKDTKTLKLT